jgi:hypothetical protein
LLNAFIIALLVCAVPIATGQSPVEPPPRAPFPEGRRLPEPRRGAIRRDAWVSEYRFNSEEKRLLEASPADKQQFATFLQQPDTGLFRLHPWGRRHRVVSVDELEDGRRPDFSLHASLYSFSKNKHGNCLNGFVDPRLGWAELKFGDGRFFTGFTGESLGVLVALGDIPLSAVTPQMAGVVGLANIIPPADYLEASALSRRNRAGFEMDKYNYGSSLPALPKTTYVLRSTSNRRADVLVVFRVTRIDSDGSATIVWLKLRGYPKPEWKRRSN